METNKHRYFILVVFGLIILWLTFLTSCSCNYHIKQLNKKCASWTKDTLNIHDTVVIPEVQRDTVFRYYLRDTVVIKKEHLTMKYYFNSKDSTVFLSGKCDSIIKYRYIKVPYDKAVVEYDVLKAIKNNSIWIIIVLIVAFLLYIFLKVIK